MTLGSATVDRSAWRENSGHRHLRCSHDVIDDRCLLGDNYADVDSGGCDNRG